MDRREFERTPVHFRKLMEALKSSPSMGWPTGLGLVIYVKTAVFSDDVRLEAQREIGRTSVQVSLDPRTPCC